MRAGRATARSKVNIAIMAAKLGRSIPRPGRSAAENRVLSCILQRISCSTSYHVWCIGTSVCLW